MLQVCGCFAQAQLVSYTTLALKPRPVDQTAIVRYRHVTGRAGSRIDPSVSLGLRHHRCEP